MMKHLLLICSILILTLGASGEGTRLRGAPTQPDHGVRLQDLRERLPVILPGDSIQAAINAAPNGLVRLAPGLHKPSFNSLHRTCLIITNGVTLDIPAGTILSMPDDVDQPYYAEIVKDQHKLNGVDDLEMRIESNIVNGVDLFVEVVSAGEIDQISVNGGLPFDCPAMWTDIGGGISIRFGAQNGHELGDGWYCCASKAEASLITIGDGSAVVDGVSIVGGGVLDGNSARTGTTSPKVANLSALIKVYGAVHNTLIDGLSFRNYDGRPIIAQGEHSGMPLDDDESDDRYIAAGYVFRDGQYTSGGQSYDVDGLILRHLIIDGRALLLGHPAHRGGVSNVMISDCRISSADHHAAELNFRLSNFVLKDNVFITRSPSKAAISLRRGPKNGLITANANIGTSDFLEKTTEPGFPPPHAISVWGNKESAADYAFTLRDDGLAEHERSKITDLLLPGTAYAMFDGATAFVTEQAIEDTLPARWEFTLFNPIDYPLSTLPNSGTATGMLIERKAYGDLRVGISIDGQLQYYSKSISQKERLDIVVEVTDTTVSIASEGTTNTYSYTGVARIGGAINFGRSRRSSASYYSGGLSDVKIYAGDKLMHQYLMQGGANDILIDTAGDLNALLTTAPVSRDIYVASGGVTWQSMIELIGVLSDLEKRVDALEVN